MHHHATRAGGQRMPFKKNNNNNFKMPAGSGYDPMNFNASQIPDNPGYMDFSDPTPPLPQNNKNVANKPAQQQQQQTGTRNSQRNKKSGGRNKQARNNNNNNKIRGNWQKNKFCGPAGQNSGGINRGGPNGAQNVGGPGPGTLNRVRGPPHMGGRGRLPPISPMGRGPLPPPMGVQQLPPVFIPPAFIRRNARGRPYLPLPPPMAMPAMMTRSGGGPLPLPMSFNGTGGGKIKKQHAKAIKKVVKGKSTIKTLKNIVNQYPLNKPWVTDEIRAEHAKKVDIENRLIGNKDDDLFAQFKVQRDKFVGLYESARENHLKSASAAVKPKDAKKQEKNQTTETDANCSNQEAISSN